MGFSENLQERKKNPIHNCHRMVISLACRNPHRSWGGLALQANKLPSLAGDILCTSGDHTVSSGAKCRCHCWYGWRSRFSLSVAQVSWGAPKHSASVIMAVLNGVVDLWLWGEDHLVCVHGTWRSPLGQVSSRSWQQAFPWGPCTGWTHSPEEVVACMWANPAALCPATWIQSTRSPPASCQQIVEQLQCQEVGNSQVLLHCASTRPI